jgi:hypothetical protein
MVATDAFAELARTAALAQGIPGVRIASVAHPIGGIDARALRERAQCATDAVLALLRES